jgi:hypothetical protein
MITSPATIAAVHRQILLKTLDMGHGCLNEV